MYLPDNLIHASKNGDIVLSDYDEKTKNRKLKTIKAIQLIIPNFDFINLFNYFHT